MSEYTDAFASIALNSSPITTGKEASITMQTLAELDRHIKAVHEANARNEDTTNEKFAAVAGDVLSLQEKLRAAERSLDTATRRIGSMEWELSSVTSQREQLKSDLGKQGKQNAAEVGQLKAEIATLTAQKEQLKFELDTLSKRYAADTANLRDTIGQLEAHLRADAAEASSKEEVFRSLTADLVKTKMAAAEQADLVNQQKRQIAQLMKTIEMNQAAAVAAPVPSERKRMSMASMTSAIGGLHLFDSSEHGSEPKVVPKKRST